MSSRKRPASQVLQTKEMIKRVRNEHLSSLGDFMVIGIDFGTTYSGAAWATIADFENNQINLVTTWPGSGREESKAPTELHYKDGEVMWGYSVPADAEPLRWFKLLLLRDRELTPELRRSTVLAQGRKMLAEMGKTPVDAIADYLRMLWKHILSTIERERSKSVVRGLAFHVVLAVPAIWPDYARKGMWEAAIEAGIFDDRVAGETTLTFAPEPEAAALASLWDRAADIKVDDAYVICDAGGGTVDLISYRVTGLSPIKLQEAVIGTGGLCGGIFIDELFESTCKARLGSRWRNLSPAGIKEIMKDEWENAVKPRFSIEDWTVEYIVAIPAGAFAADGAVGLNDSSTQPHIRDGRIHFRSSDIQPAFDAAFRDVHELVNNQVSEARKKQLAVKGVILVGGLGSSPYLYQFLETRLGQRGIDILQARGVRPRTAICRGAIFKGFLDRPSVTKSGTLMSDTTPVSVVSTIARKSLGVEFTTTFDRRVHLQVDKCWDADEGRWRAIGQMEWYLRKGDNVSTKTPVRHEFHRSYTCREDFNSAMAEGLDIAIVECHDTFPPARRTESVTKLCDIHVVLPSIGYTELEECFGQNEKPYRNVYYTVEMIPSGESTTFLVYYDGRKIGSKDVAIRFD